jgi:hypothetical protein
MRWAVFEYYLLAWLIFIGVMLVAFAVLVAICMGLRWLHNIYTRQ